MKNKILMIIASAGLVLAANPASAQVEEGNVIIDPYYGYPNFGKSIMNSLISSDAENTKATGIGPLGLRAEYMLADNLGLGIDFIYNSAGIEGDVTRTDSLGNSMVYTDKISMQRIRVLLRFNYHFVQTDALDAYIGGGAGYNTRIWKYTSTDPNYEEPSETGSLLPVAFRVAIGARYYFTDNIGLNAEIGLGGPVLSAGVSIKF